MRRASNIGGMNARAITARWCREPTMAAASAMAHRPPGGVTTPTAGFGIEQGVAGHGPHRVPDLRVAA